MSVLQQNEYFHNYFCYLFAELVQDTTQRLLFTMVSKIGLVVLCVFVNMARENCEKAILNLKRMAVSFEGKTLGSLPL